MGYEFLILVAVIFILSIVQSIFGMGILVFGTPTLILIGYSFTETLCILLPASFAISLLQTVDARARPPIVHKNLFMLCVPAIVLGLVVVGAGNQSKVAHTLIGMMLIVSAGFRLSPALESKLRAIVQRQTRAYHIVMGLVHGMTNLGGALLSVLAATTQTDKGAFRYMVSYYYLVFSAIQMAVLVLVLDKASVLWQFSYTAVIAAAVYFLIGNRLFQRANGPAYQKAMTGFMAAYGAVLLFNG